VKLTNNLKPEGFEFWTPNGGLIIIIKKKKQNEISWVIQWFDIICQVKNLTIKYRRNLCIFQSLGSFANVCAWID
jgi:hypothetical protein